MGLEKEELGLSLSLSSSVPRPPATFLLHAPERRFFDVPLLGAIGANGAAAAAAATETDTSTVGKRSEREPLNSGDERASPRGISDEEDGGDGSRKKLRLSKNQSAVLEESFRDHPTLNPKQKLALANQLGLRPRQVEVWFQNRRARTKLKQTEVDCELLKRCCEKLTEENRRLQKEVQELRALKLISPQLYMQMSPPTTLTMCPSCERVSNSGAATTNRTTSVCHRPVAVRPPFLDAPPQHS